MGCGIPLADSARNLGSDFTRIGEHWKCLPKLLSSKFEGVKKVVMGETHVLSNHPHLTGSFPTLGNRTRWLGF